MNEKLIAYLEKQLAERCVVIDAYAEAVEAEAAAQAALEAAQAKVAAFGDMEAIEAEAAEVRGFIESLSAPVERDEPAEEVEEVAEEMCAECTIAEEAPAAPATTAIPGYGVLDETV